MNTRRLECMIECDPVLKRRVMGVYAMDRLPDARKRETPYGLIANIDGHEKSGTHWIAMYFTEKDGEFFDSYGHPPGFFSTRFATYLSRNAPTTAHNDKKIQSYYSDVCGEYCVMYLLYRSRGYSMKDMTDLFDSRHDDENDCFVREYINSTFPHCIPDEHSIGQGCTCRAKV